MSSAARADDAPQPKSDPPYVWLAPLAMAGVSAGAMSIANAEGMSWGRVVGDSALASIGLGIGAIGSVLLLQNERLDKLIYGVAVLTVGATFGGVALGEKLSGHDPFPKGTSWPTAGGFAVGVGVDLAAFIAVMDDNRKTPLMAVMLVLLPIVIGTASVAGFSLGLPKS